MITFVDTSIFCNLIPVPGFDQDREAVIRAFLQRREKEHFILPVTAVIETGNHIAHLPHGGERRHAADKYARIVELVLVGEAPWTLHEFKWGSDFLRALLDGGGSGSSLVDHATRGVGVGDLCILAERRAYAALAQVPVGIWTLDSDLSAHSEPWRPPPR
jgi:hypothetical protein